MKTIQRALSVKACCSLNEAFSVGIEPWKFLMVWNFIHPSLVGVGVGVA